MKDEVPVWMAGLIAIITALGGVFWKSTSSTFVAFIKGKNSIKIKEIEMEISRAQKLEHRVETVETMYQKVALDKERLRTAMIFMLQAYEDTNPDNKTVIMQVRSMIGDSLKNES